MRQLRLRRTSRLVERLERCSHFLGRHEEHFVAGNGFRIGKARAPHLGNPAEQLIDEHLVRQRGHRAVPTSILASSLTGIHGSVPLRQLVALGPHSPKIASSWPSEPSISVSEERELPELP